MCKCLTRDQIKTFGMLSLSFVLLMSIICIFVQGYDYQQLDMRWAEKGEWKFTAIFQVSSIVFAVGFTLLGGLTFLCVDSKPLQLIVSIYFLSIIVFCNWTIVSNVFILHMCVYTYRSCC